MARLDGRQNYRRVGRAWVSSDGNGGWRWRRGRLPEGYLDRRAAERAMDALIDKTEHELVEIQPDREATFAQAAAEFREWAEHTRRLGASTLRNCDAMLSPPGERARGGGQREARIMRAFADRPIAEITSAEIERFLRGLDRQGFTGRNVNSNGQVLANVFEYATRPDAFAHLSIRFVPSTSAARITRSRRRLSTPSGCWRSRAPRARESTSAAGDAGPAKRRTSNNSASIARTP